MKIDRQFSLATCVIGVLFGLTVLVPHILQHTDGSHPFRGVELMPTDAEIHYSARVREVWDGHLAVSNTFYKEPKDLPYLQPPYPEAAVSLLAWFFGTEPATMFVWSRGFFAFILVLVLTSCMTAISGRKWESLIAVTCLLFAGSMLSAPWDLGALITGSHPFEALRFSRPINPLWTVPWFAGALLFLSRWLKNRSTMTIIWSALCTTVLLYSYVYAWTLIGVAMAVLFIRFLILRDWKRVGDMLLFGAIFFALGTPYLLNLWETLHHPFYASASQRFGMSDVRTPVIGVWAIVFLCVPFLTRKLWKEQWWLLFGLALASILLLNQHVLTGSHMVPHHYHWYFIQPLASLTTVLAALWLLSHIRVPSVVRTAGASVICILAVSIGLLVQIRAYPAAAEEWGSRQYLGPVIESLQSLPADAAIYAQDRWLLDLLPIYTSLNVYSATNANTYLVNPQQVRDVYWFELWTQGFDPGTGLTQFKTDMRFTVSSRVYNIYYRELLGSYDRIPDDVLEELATDYAAYARLPLADKLCRWPLDYVVFADTDEQTPAWNQIRENTDQVLTGSGFTVGRINESLCR